METYYKKIEIRSEDDLPKGNDAYISHSNAGHIAYRRCVPAKKQDHATFENISGEWWMKNISWYLLPIEPLKEVKSKTPTAYEFHNYDTGHCYVDYTARNLEDKENGYTKIPLYASQFQTEQRQVTDEEIEKWAEKEVHKTGFDVTGIRTRMILIGAKAMRDGLIKNK